MKYINMYGKTKNKTKLSYLPQGIANLLHELKVNYTFFFLLLPGFVIVFLLNYLPIPGIILAFKKYQFIDRNFFINLLKCPWVGFDNFWIFFNDPQFAKALFNTVTYNLFFMVTGTVISLAIALAINEMTNRKIAKLYHSLMLLPYFLSWIVFSYVVFAFLGMENGYINNSILIPLGFDEISWYTEPKYWPVILFIVNTIKGAAYGSILYLSAIVGLDPEYFEMARIYGANKWQQITKITLPLISNVVIILVILNLGNILSADFGMFYNVPLRSKQLRETTQIIDIYIYEMFQDGAADLGKSTAAGLFKSVFGMVMVLSTNYIVRKIDPDKTLF